MNMTLMPSCRERVISTTSSSTEMEIITDVPLTSEENFVPNPSEAPSQAPSSTSPAAPSSVSTLSPSAPPASQDEGYALSQSSSVVVSNRPSPLPLIPPATTSNLVAPASRGVLQNTPLSIPSIRTSTANYASPTSSSTSTAIPTSSSYAARSMSSSSYAARATSSRSNGSIPKTDSGKPSFDQSGIQKGTSKPANFDVIIYSVIGLALLLLAVFTFCVFRRFKRQKTQPADAGDQKPENPRKDSFVFPQTWSESTPSWINSPPAEQFTISSKAASQEDLEGIVQTPVSGQSASRLSQISIVKSTPSTGDFHTVSSDEPVVSNPKVHLRLSRPIIHPPSQSRAEAQVLPTLLKIDTGVDFPPRSSSNAPFRPLTPLTLDEGPLTQFSRQTSLTRFSNVSSDGTDESNYIAALASRAAGLRDSVMSYESSTRSLA